MLVVSDKDLFIKKKFDNNSNILWKQRNVKQVQLQNMEQF